jgi:hypothetical protein
VSLQVQRVPASNICLAFTIAALLFPGLVVFGGVPSVLVIYPGFCFLMIVGFSVVTQPTWWLWVSLAALVNYLSWVTVVYLFVRILRSHLVRQGVRYLCLQYRFFFDQKE